MSFTTEDLIINKAKDGERLAYGLLFESCYNAAYYFALKLTLSKEVSVKILQKIFSDFAALVDEYSEGSSFNVIVFKKIYKLAIDYNRKIGFYQEEAPFFEKRIEIESEFFIDRSFETESANSFIIEIIERMPLRQKAALILHYFMRLKKEDIAYIIDVPLTNISYLIETARGYIDINVEKYKNTGGTIFAENIIEILAYIIKLNANDNTLDGKHVLQILEHVTKSDEPQMQEGEDIGSFEFEDGPFSHRFHHRKSKYRNFINSLEYAVNTGFTNAISYIKTNPLIIASALLVIFALAVGTYSVTKLVYYVSNSNLTDNPQMVMALNPENPTIISNVYNKREESIEDKYYNYVKLNLAGNSSFNHAELLDLDNDNVPELILYTKVNPGDTSMYNKPFNVHIFKYENGAIVQKSSKSGVYVSSSPQNYTVYFPVSNGAERYIGEKSVSSKSGSGSIVTTLYSLNGNEMKAVKSYSNTHTQVEETEHIVRTNKYSDGTKEITQGDYNAFMKNYDKSDTAVFYDGANKAFTPKREYAIKQDSNNLLRFTYDPKTDYVSSYAEFLKTQNEFLNFSFQEPPSAIVQDLNNDGIEELITATIKSTSEETPKKYLNIKVYSIADNMITEVGNEIAFIPASTDTAFKYLSVYLKPEKDNNWILVVEDATVDASPFVNRICLVLGSNGLVYSENNALMFDNSYLLLQKESTPVSYNSTGVRELTYVYSKGDTLTVNDLTKNGQNIKNFSRTGITIPYEKITALVSSKGLKDAASVVYSAVTNPESPAVKRDLFNFNNYLSLRLSTQTKPDDEIISLSKETISESVDAAKDAKSTLEGLAKSYNVEFGRPVKAIARVNYVIKKNAQHINIVADKNTLSLIDGVDELHVGVLGLVIKIDSAKLKDILNLYTELTIIVEKHNALYRIGFADVNGSTVDLPASLDFAFPAEAASYVIYCGPTAVGGQYDENNHLLEIGIFKPGEYTAAAGLEKEVSTDIESISVKSLIPSAVSPNGIMSFDDFEVALKRISYIEDVQNYPPEQRMPLPEITPAVSASPAPSATASSKPVITPSPTPRPTPTSAPIFGFEDATPFPNYATPVQKTPTPKPEATPAPTADEEAIAYSGAHSNILRLAKGQPLTKAEIAKAAYDILKGKLKYEDVQDPSRYIDTSDLTDEEINSFALLQKEGLINYTGKINPSLKISNSEAARVINGLYNRLHETAPSALTIRDVFIGRNLYYLIIISFSVCVVLLLAALVLFLIHLKKRRNDDEPGEDEKDDIDDEDIYETEETDDVEEKTDYVNENMQMPKDIETPANEEEESGYTESNITFEDVTETAGVYESSDNETFEEAAKIYEPDQSEEAEKAPIYETLENEETKEIIESEEPKEADIYEIAESEETPKTLAPEQWEEEEEIGVDDCMPWMLPVDEEKSENNGEDSENTEDNNLGEMPMKKEGFFKRLFRKKDKGSSEE